MASKAKKTNEHMFSIELKSKDFVKTLAVSNENEGNVLMEGFLGRLESLNLIEGVMLEIEGANGSFRMDFSEKELIGLLPKETPVLRNTVTGWHVTQSKDVRTRLRDMKGMKGEVNE